MHLLEKVYNSRLQLKKLLSNEWSVEPIHDVSLKELGIMYEADNEDIYLDNGCNFTLTNLKIPSHKLHVIYYNFPELHRSGTKVNKTCCDKLLSYYEKEGFEGDYLFEKEDSLLIIINLPVSESLEQNIENMYLKGQDELMKYGLTTEIRSQMKSNKFKMDKSYFRNIHIFHVDTLAIDVLSHRLVPKHEVIRDKKEIDTVFKMTNSNPQLLPVILRADPIAKLLRICPGNICKITRTSKTSGNSTYYRICK